MPVSESRMSLLNFAMIRLVRRDGKLDSQGQGRLAGVQSASRLAPAYKNSSDYEQSSHVEGTCGLSLWANMSLRDEGREWNEGVKILVKPSCFDSTCHVQDSTSYTTHHRQHGQYSVRTLRPLAAAVVTGPGSRSATRCAAAWVAGCNHPTVASAKMTTLRIGVSDRFILKSDSHRGACSSTWVLWTVISRGWSGN